MTFFEVTRLLDDALEDTLGHCRLEWLRCGERYPSQQVALTLWVVYVETATSLHLPDLHDESQTLCDELHDLKIDLIDGFTQLGDVGRHSRMLAGGIDQQQPGCVHPDTSGLRIARGNIDSTLLHGTLRQVEPRPAAL